MDKDTLNKSACIALMESLSIGEKAYPKLSSSSKYFLDFSKHCSSGQHTTMFLTWIQLIEPQVSYFSLHLVMNEKSPRNCLLFVPFAWSKLPMLLNAWSLFGTYLFILCMILLSGTFVACLASCFLLLHTACIV